MILRWVDSDIANNHRLALDFTFDVGWGWPSSVVLQQKWINDGGEEKWKDIELILNKDKFTNTKDGS